MNDVEKSPNGTDHDSTSSATSTDNRHIKSAPARLHLENQNQQITDSNNPVTDGSQQQQKISPQIKTEDSPFPPFVFPPLAMEGERSEEGHERSRPTGAVPPSFGQAVHRYYTKDIKRSTSPDPYLYEANLSRIRSFHYQAWLRWMESKKRKQQSPRHPSYPRPALSPEMRQPNTQNLVLDMSSPGTTEPSTFPPHRYSDPASMIDLSKFTRKRKREELVRDKPEDLSRHELNNVDMEESRCRSGALEDWTTTDVVKFVAAIPSCREYAHLFEDQLITGQSLTLLTLENLTNNLNMKLGPALTLRASVAQLTDQCVQCTHCIHCHGGNKGLV